MSKAESERQDAGIIRVNRQMSNQLRRTEERNDALIKDLEIMYLQAIGSAETLEQLEGVRNRLLRSEYDKTFRKQTAYEITDSGVWISGSPHPKILLAINTKKRRLTAEYVKNSCKLLDKAKDNPATSYDGYYASAMARLIKKVADVDVRASDIEKERATGVSSYCVFLSVLVTYNVEIDCLMERK